VPTSENEALVRRLFDAFARRDGFALRQVFAEDAVWTVPGRSGLAGVYRGRHAIFRFLARLSEDTAGTYSTRLVDAMASETRAAVLYHASGTRNGRDLDLDQVLLFRIDGGCVVEVTALPCDPLTFEEFWGAAES
jgi:uncharacterized protein (TIGR02246 family)